MAALLRNSNPLQVLRGEVQSEQPASQAGGNHADGEGAAVGV